MQRRGFIKIGGLATGGLMIGITFSCREKQFKESPEYKIQQDYKEFLKSDQYKEFLKNKNRGKLPQRIQTLENLNRQTRLDFEQEHEQFC